MSDSDPFEPLVYSFQYKYLHFQEPFCLYPGESLVDAERFGAGSNDYKKAIKPQPVIKANSAVRLRAHLDFTDDDGNVRHAGDMWQLEGPLMYFPTPNAVSLTDY